MHLLGCSERFADPPSDQLFSFPNPDVHTHTHTYVDTHTAKIRPCTMRDTIVMD